MRSVLLLVTALATVLGAWAQAPQGRWDGSLVFDKSFRVPFRLFFEGSGNSLRAWLVNGDLRQESSEVVFSGTTLRLAFQPSGLTLEGSFGDGRFAGTAHSAKYGERPFSAAPYCTCSFDGEAGPDISGEWLVEGTGWGLKVRRVEEDTFADLVGSPEALGPLSGRFDGVAFLLRFFDGRRAALLEMEPLADGSLALSWRSPEDGAKKLKAVQRR